VPKLLAQAGIERRVLRGVGIGFGGPVDDATHTVIKSHQIEGWDNFPLADWISEVVGLPAVLGNDADVAGLAEALHGAGKGLSPILYITIGSGIGGGFIINGEIYRGCGRGAAEIGHLRVAIPRLDLPGDPLGYGPLESVASGWGIENFFRRLAERYPHELIHLAADANNITTHFLAELMAKGDPDVMRFFDIPLEALSEAICHV